MIGVPASSLVLGAVQLGLPYGVANKTGKPDMATALDIVRAAWESGITEFDTAQDYGDSERVLGQVFQKLGISAQATVVSKIDPTLDHLDRSVMMKAVDASLTKLGVSRLSGLLLHDETLLDEWDRGVSDIFSDVARSGKVERVGVSVYSPQRAWEALNKGGIDMVQLPSNILDRRFEALGVFELAEKRNKQIYVRSVYLQGLILMDPEELPGHIAFARPVVERVRVLTQELGLSLPALALGYLRARVPGAKLIVGVETPEQVLLNAASAEAVLTQDQVAKVVEYFGEVDVKVLNPALWKANT